MTQVTAKSTERRQVRSYPSKRKSMVLRLRQALMHGVPVRTWSAEESVMPNTGVITRFSERLMVDTQP